MAFLDDTGVASLVAKIKAKIDSLNVVNSVAGKTGNVTLEASDIASGTFTTTQIPSLAASKITSGTFAAARLPNATTSSKGGVIVGSGLSVSSGTISVLGMTGATSSAAGAAGLVPAPAMGDQNKFLRGDGTWQAAGSGSDVQITRYSATLNPSTWTYNSTYGWYEETVSVQGFTYINTIKNIDIDIDLSTNNKTTALQIQEDWALVGRIYVDSNGLHAICYNDTPTYSIPLLMCVMITGE